MNHQLKMFLLKAFQISRSKEKQYSEDYLPFVSQSEMNVAECERLVRDARELGFIQINSEGKEIGFNFIKRFFGMQINDFQNELR